MDIGNLLAGLAGNGVLGIICAILFWYVLQQRKELREVHQRVEDALSARTDDAKATVDTVIEMNTKQNVAIGELTDTLKDLARGLRNGR